MKLFELWGSVDADTRPFDRSLARSRGALTGFAGFAARVSAGITRSFERMSRAVGAVANGLRASVTGGGIFGALSVAAGAAGLFVAIRKAVDGASDLNETLQKTGVVFGSSASIVNKGADDMARRFGVVKKEYLDAAASLGLIGKAAGLSESASAGLADKLARIAIDASSFYNVPIEEALIAMRAGLVGESEPLRRFGVLLNEAAVQNEALRLGLANSRKEISEGAKVQARSSLIIRGLADATGDLERTQGSFANMTRKLAGQVTNLLTRVGAEILPVFQAGITAVSKIVGDLSASFEKNAVTVRVWADKISGYIALAGQVWKNFGDFKELGGLLIHEKIIQGLELVKGAFLGIGAVAKAIWENIVEGGKNSLTILMNTFKGLSRYLETLFESIGKALAVSLGNAVADFANSPIVTGLGQIPGLTAHVAVLQGLAQASKLQAPPIRGDTSGLSQAAILKGTSINGQAIMDKISDSLTNVFAYFGESLESVRAKIKGVVGRIEKAQAAETIGDMLDRLKGMVRGLTPRALTPVERLNADSRRRGLNRPAFTDTDKEGQARAEGILKRRAEADRRSRALGNINRPAIDGTRLARKDPEEAEIGYWRRRAGNLDRVDQDRLERDANAGLSGKSLRDAIESRRLKNAARGTSPERIQGTNDGGGGRGVLGMLGQGAAKLADKLGDKLGLGEGARKVLGGVAAAAVGGVPGLVGGVGGRGAAGRRAGNQGGRGPLAGSGEFKSEFVGLSEFSKQLSTDALSRSKKDPQLNALEGIAKSIGGGGGEGESVVGLLKGIKQAGTGPGFAT